MSGTTSERKPSLAGLSVVVTMLAVLCLAAGCGDEAGRNGTVSGDETSAVSPRKADVIVFIRAGEVWAINPENGIERQVTSDGSIKSWPRLSPDGAQILYQVSPGGDGRFSDIWRVGLAEGSTPDCIRESGGFPAWSTDGKSIAFVRKSPAHDNQQTDDIAVISADDPGGAEQILTDHKNVVDSGGPLAVQNLEYSPDGGKYIYFMRGRRSDSRWLARVEVATKQEEDLLAPPGSMPEALADGGFSLFNVSQMEGRRALISRGGLTAGDFQQNQMIYIRFLEPPLDDSLIEDSAGSINPSLKPDNTRFAYENAGVIYKHNLAGGPGIEKIADGSMPDWGMSAVGPGFDDDGDTLTTGTTTSTTGTGTTTSDNSGENGSGGTHPCADGPRNDDYIRNGDFELGLADWQVVDIKKKGVNRVEVTDDPDCGTVLTFTRANSGNDGGMSAVAQDLDVKVDDLRKLSLRLVTSIESQDLSGDGWYGGESPAFVTVEYTTIEGVAKTWSHGLVISGPVNYPDRDQIIPARQWLTWDSPDLMAELPGVDRITKITIGGSGWDFQSRIGRVWLRGKH
ncbi:MAG: PD40 domain-containing protein [Actinobacteria bacterium]|nr:PD40 domain-containing protein [Actinomycetota bacterium]